MMESQRRAYKIGGKCMIRSHNLKSTALRPTGQWHEGSKFDTQACDGRDHSDLERQNFKTSFASSWLEFCWPNQLQPRSSRFAYPRHYSPTECLPGQHDESHHCGLTVTDTGRSCHVHLVNTSLILSASSLVECKNCSRSPMGPRMV